MAGNQHIPCEDIKNLTREVDRVYGYVTGLRNKIDGNGTPGIAKKVENHEKYINQEIGKDKMLRGVLAFSGFNVVGVIALLIKVFG